MKDFDPALEEDDATLDRNTKLTGLPELGEDWDQDVQDFLGEFSNEDWDY